MIILFLISSILFWSFNIPFIYAIPTILSLYTIWIQCTILYKLPKPLLICPMGSGGHSYELSNILSKFKYLLNFTLIFFVNHHDVYSLEEICRRLPHIRNFKLVRVYRPRHVGEGVFSSIMTTIKSLLYLIYMTIMTFLNCKNKMIQDFKTIEDLRASLKRTSKGEHNEINNSKDIGNILVNTSKDKRENLIQPSTSQKKQAGNLFIPKSKITLITTGPGIAVTIWLAISSLFIPKLHFQTIFIESVCRVQNLSLSGKIMYYLSNVFIVQWEELALKYTSAIHFKNQWLL